MIFRNEKVVGSGPAGSRVSKRPGLPLSESGVCCRRRPRSLGCPQPLQWRVSCRLLQGHRGPGTEPSCPGLDFTPILGPVTDERRVGGCFLGPPRVQGCWSSLRRDTHWRVPCRHPPWPRSLQYVFAQSQGTVL